MKQWLYELLEEYGMVCGPAWLKKRRGRGRDVTCRCCDVWQNAEAETVRSQAEVIHEVVIDRGTHGGPANRDRRPISFSA